MAAQADQQMNNSRPRALRRYSFPHQVEIDAATAQLSEITLHPTKCRIELHSHRHHAVARHYAGIPDLAPPVSVLVVVPIGLYVLAGDFTDLRRTGEVLILVRGQHFPLNIGKVKIVEPAAIEYGNERAGAAMGELALQDEIRRELVDSAAGLLH